MASAEAREIERYKSFETWLRDTRVLWCKLLTAAEDLKLLGEEAFAQSRETQEMRPSDGDAVARCLDKSDLPGTARRPDAAPTRQPGGRAGV